MPRIVMQTSKNIYSRHNKGTYSLVKKIYTTVSQYSTKIGIFQMTVCQSILNSFKKAKLALSIIYSSFKCTVVNFLCCAYIYNAILSSTVLYKEIMIIIIIITFVKR